MPWSKQLDGEANRLAWLAPAPANNTWVIATRGDLPGFPARRCLDDLAAYLAAGGRFKLAASANLSKSPAALRPSRKPTAFSCARASC